MLFRWGQQEGLPAYQGQSSAVKGERRTTTLSHSTASVVLSEHPTDALGQVNIVVLWLESYKTSAVVPQARESSALIRGVGSMQKP